MHTQVWMVRALVTQRLKCQICELVWNMKSSLEKYFSSGFRKFHWACWRRYFYWCRKQLLILRHLSKSLEAGIGRSLQVMFPLLFPSCVWADLRSCKAPSIFRHLSQLEPQLKRSRHWHAHAPILPVCSCLSHLCAASKLQDKVLLWPGEMSQCWCIWPRSTLLSPCSLQVLDSIYFSRRFHVRCVAKAVDKAGHVGTPLRSNTVTIGTDSAICHTPVVAGTARGFQAQSFVATLKYLDVKHKEHPNRYKTGRGHNPLPGLLEWQSPPESCHCQAYHVCSALLCDTGLPCLLALLFLFLIHSLFQDSHLGSDPAPGWYAAPHLHPAATQSAFPALWVYLQTSACLLKPGHHQRP